MSKGVPDFNLWRETMTRKKLPKILKPAKRGKLDPKDIATAVKKVIEQSEVVPKFVEEHVSTDVQMSRLGNLEWSVARLFELSKNLEVMDIPLKHINMYYRYEKLSLRQLAGHVVAVNEADLKYPIILDEDGELMDGRHRLIKAIITGEDTIKAVRFDINPAPCRNDGDTA
jgi:hypothetical protein